MGSPNLTGTRHVMQAARRAGVARVLHVSSTAVYRHRWNRVLREDAAPWSATDRGRVRDDALSKALSDQQAVSLSEELSLPLVRLRPCAVYGSGDRVHGPLLDRWLARLPVLGVPDVGWPLVHAADVAAAAVVAATLDQALGRAYNLAGAPEPLSRILRRWRDARGWRRPWIGGVPVPLSAAYDTTSAERDLGFTARPLSEGISEAIHHPADAR